MFIFGGSGPGRTMGEVMQLLQQHQGAQWEQYANASRQAQKMCRASQGQPGYTLTEIQQAEFRMTTQNISRTVEEIQSGLLPGSPDPIEEKTLDIGDQGGKVPPPPITENY